MSVLLRKARGFEGLRVIQEVLLPDHQAPSERKELEDRPLTATPLPEPCPRC